jgi:acyl transferase domain-containing protein
VIVKSLSDALRDGDTIRAVVRATGSAPEEETELGLPSEQAQVELIKKIYEKAHLNRRLTRYMEAYDTMTVPGHTLEAVAVGAAFDCERSHDDPLYM